MKVCERNHRGHRDKINSLWSPKEFPLKDIAGKIIAYAIELHSNLGPELLESVYKEALAYEFERSQRGGTKIFHKSLMNQNLCALCG